MISEDELSGYLELDEQALLMEIARASSTEPLLQSPDALIERGRVILQQFYPTLRSRICPNVGLSELPEVQLGLAIAGFLLGGIPGALLAPLSAYVVRRGVPIFCADWDPKK